MLLLLDLQGCQNNSRHRGIGRYSLSLAKAMLRNRGSHRVMLLLNGLFADMLEPLRQEFKGLAAPEDFIVLDVPGPVNELHAESAWRVEAAELLRETLIAELAPDAVLVSSMVEGGMDNTVSSVGWLDGPTLHAAVLYDLIPLLDPDQYIGWPPARRWYMNKMESLQRCGLLLAISASAKREAEQALGVEPERVVNISTAADELFAQATVDEPAFERRRQRFGIDRPYLMHSGNVEPRKNFQGLVKAFAALPAALRSAYQLVLVGKVSDDGRQQLEALATAEGLSRRDLVLTGHVSDDELLALYAGCHLFVFPSLHEGFGLPALEAMHLGAATIGSNTTSVPEVIGLEEATFNPRSVPAMTALIRRCLEDNAFHARLRRHAREQSARFTWDHCAGSAWHALEQALAADRTHVRRASDTGVRRALTVDHLGGSHGLAGRPDDELLAAARSMARNEIAVERARAHAGLIGSLTWRIEGPFDSNYSLALVNRESARALDALGHRVALHSTEGPGDFEPSPSFLAKNPALAAMYERAAALPHAACTVLSRNLYPPRVADMAGAMNVLHPYAWEESGFPPDWVDDFNQHLHGIAAVSEHVIKVLLDNGVKVPLAAVGNGVDHWERLRASAGLPLPGKRFRFLHVSSCFPRKGADVMLAAYGATFSASDDVSLLIKTFANPHNDIREQIAACRAANPRFPDVHVIEGDWSDADLKALYEHCHVLVAPSRAEGFGLPMAEAMLSGLPVITTNWGGQTDFCAAANSWLVDYRFVPAQSHFGLHGSVWAEPDQASLALAMRRAHDSSTRERARRAQHGRELLLGHYTWADVTARAITAVQTWQAAPRAAPRVGWITTWNSRCGIATYARHLIEAEPQPHWILAPRDAGLVREDETHVRRCWHAGKQDNLLADLAGAIADIGLDVLLLQFNYGFHNFHALAEFVHDQVDLGRTIVVTMHATADPPDLAEQDDNWRLATLVPALRRCARLLVHSVADLNRLKAAGLVDNVCLFPHPLWRLPAGVETGVAAPAGPGPLLATFGFCLPHKGLREVVDAVAELRRQGLSVRLLMLNAEHPAPSSAAMADALRVQIDRLGLHEQVRLVSEFLPEAKAAALLGLADLLVFAYQDTQESASGAVRHALATGRPVLVTPIPIFDELGAAVHRSAGGDASALASAVRSTLAALAAAGPEARAVAGQASRLRESLDVGRLSRRLWNLIGGLHARAAPRPRYCFCGSSRLLQSQLGVVRGRSRQADGVAGTLLTGPQLRLTPGAYELRIEGAWLTDDSAPLHIEVAASDHPRLTVPCSGRTAAVSTGLARHRLHLRTARDGVSFRVLVEAGTRVRIDFVALDPVGT